MWYTTKDGKHINTDWFDKDRQIAENKRQADELNGSSNLSDVLGNAKYKSGIEALDRCVEGNLINPHVNDGDEYKNNCARCTVATALQCQGYDVEALGKKRGETNFDAEDVFDIDISNPNNMMMSKSKNTYGYQYSHYKRQLDKLEKPITPTITPKDVGAVTNKVKEMVVGWGNGSYGEIRITWSKESGGTGGHSLFIFNRNGKVIMYDAQCNRMYDDIEFVLKHTEADATWMARLDNAQMNETKASKNLPKMVRKRG